MKGQALVVENGQMTVHENHWDKSRALRVTLTVPGILMRHHQLLKAETSGKFISIL